MREALSQRVDGAEEVKKEMREDMAGDKRKLKVHKAFTHSITHSPTVLLSWWLLPVAT